MGDISFPRTFACKQQRSGRSGPRPHAPCLDTQMKTGTKLHHGLIYPEEHVGKVQHLPACEGFGTRLFLATETKNAVSRLNMHVHRPVPYHKYSPALWLVQERFKWF